MNAISCVAFLETLPQDVASESVEPPRPPQCGASVVTCSAYLWPPVSMPKM